jgi:hypothetical protein
MVIEVVNSQIKNFNLISRWRKIKTFVAYLYAYAIAYSFLEKVNYGGNFSPKVYIFIFKYLNNNMYLTMTEVGIKIYF